MRGIVDVDIVCRTLQEEHQRLCAQPLTFWAESRIFDEHVPVAVGQFPSEGCDYVIQAATVAQAWPQILSTVIKFGTRKQSNHLASGQIEAWNVIATITRDDPGSGASGWSSNYEWCPCFTFTREAFNAYAPQVTTPTGSPSLSYTYGQRLMSYGDAHVNQIYALVQCLTEEPYSRRAVAITWNVGDSQSPSLVCVQCGVINKYLYMTSTFRCCDVYHDWPRDALALRLLHRNVLDLLNSRAPELRYKLGPMTSVMTSAYVPRDSIDDISRVIGCCLPRVICRHDPRGDLFIKLVDGCIVLTHQSPSGLPLNTYKFKNVLEAMESLTRDLVISDVNHAVYIGMELSKVEMALKHKLTYVQDEPLQFTVKLFYCVQYILYKHRYLECMALLIIKDHMILMISVKMQYHDVQIDVPLHCS